LPPFSLSASPGVLVTPRFRPHVLGCAHPSFQSVQLYRYFFIDLSLHQRHLSFPVFVYPCIIVSVYHCVHVFVYTISQLYTIVHEYRRTEYFSPLKC
jgi:hypothetical protein